MKYTGPTFRPPLEANTLLLQVTVGCAHNKCSFCTMYKETKFQIESLEQIEKDLREAKEKRPSIDRIFLVNGDAFVLSARRLKEISDKIIEVYPDIKTITMYGAVRNIKDKTDEDLEMLRKARINELWVGIESGHKETVTYLNKGHDLNDAYVQLERLSTFDIAFNGIFMLGIAGHNKGLENAQATAQLINKTKPKLVGFTSLGIFKGSKLEKDYLSGDFSPATEYEILQEEKHLLNHITIEVPFYGTHPTNAANVKGILPKDRDNMLLEIDETIKIVDEDFLNASANRYSL
ncbi:radical SAM protein [Acidaminobacter sp. JC074]|uniref:radical SAM protein n=1 Tax=Acidaminobacter sp. JC074 TaxID=2530199 RepID=UPI001F1059DB|nr:radical SAM protein [Acidaminobacter sp. JC074]MCH4889521.1 radical SAM protein [Acidaminobacter sp. JC074]